MRTTLTLDPDVAALLSQEMRRTGATLKPTVNQLLRRAFAGAPGLARKRFRYAARPLGLRPGFDPDRMNQLYDQLETESFLGQRRQEMQDKNGVRKHVPRKVASD